MVDTPNDRPEPGPRLLAGRYRLGQRRGGGAAAALFDAFDEQLQRVVVVQLVHPELSARTDVQDSFRSTMQLAGALHHPNVAPVLEWGATEWNGHHVLFVVSEHLTGGSLRDLLDRGRLLSPSQAVLVGLDACKALDALHRRGLVHGGVRPSTLIFGDDRRLRLVDVGLSLVIDQALGAATHRSNDVAKYASPEEASGALPGTASDVYSLCLTVVELVTGRVPFAGDSTVATLANRVDRLLPVSADLGALASVLERAGRPDPSERSTAADFGRGLVQAAERLPRPAPLPLLSSSLFAPEPVVPGAPVEPTGPLTRPTLPPEPVAGEPAADEPSAAPQPVADEAAADEPAADEAAAVEAPIESAVEPQAAPAVDVPTDTGPASPPPLPPPPPPVMAEPVIAVPVAVPDVAPAADGLDDLEPGDEFPEHPPATGTGRRWFLALLTVMAVAGGALAWWSAQPEEKRVPAVVGMEAAEAENVLQGDFTVILADEASETVPVGQVVRTDPEAGTTVDKGSDVTLYVSTGPAPRVLPELTGLSVDEARSKLEGMGLVVELADPVFDETVPVDVVVSWTVPDSPALVAGGTVLKGTAVRLVVSAGPAPRTVPDLTNMTRDEATAALQALGLTFTEAPEEFSNDIGPGRVIRQEPAAGGSAERGSAVTVVISKGQDLVALPDLTGMTYDQMVTALTNAGFTLGPVQGDTTQPLMAVYVNNAPAGPGQVALRGTAAVLVFAPTPAPTP